MLVKTLRGSAALVAVAAGVAAFLAPGGLAAGGRAADSICNISSSSKWQKLGSDIDVLGNKVSAAFAGGSASDGVAAAKSIASKIRAERGMLAKASGDKKLKSALVTLYDRAAVMYDRLAQKLPTIAPLMAKVKKNPADTKSLGKVMSALASVLQPASQALQKTSIAWSDALKACK